MRPIAGLTAFVLLICACSTGGDTALTTNSDTSAVAAEGSIPRTTELATETTVAIAEPVADVQSWPVGPEFAATEFEHEGEIRQRSIWLLSFSSGSFDVSFDTCAFGGHTEFEITGDRLLIDDVYHMEDIGCSDEPTPVLEDGQALEDLFVSEPRISVTEDTITIENETTRLVLKTGDPTDNQPVAPTGVWFHGISTTDPAINPERVSMIVRAFFVIEFQLETCSLHAQVGALQQVDRRDVISGFDPSDCPSPSESDQAVMDLLGSGPVLLYADDQLTITGADGTVITLN